MNYNFNHITRGTFPHYDMAKLQKKLVKNNGFWKINAIRPKIKAKRGRTRKRTKRGNAKFGGLVKELGCQIVTQNGFANRANKSYAQFENMPTSRFGGASATFLG